MEHLPMIDELAVIAGLGAGVALILSRFKLPTVAGLLLAGALVGPFGLGLVNSQKVIEVISEIGVVMLLFTIGLEFSMSRLREIFRQVAVGGVAQVGITIAAAAGVTIALGGTTEQGVFYGFVFALSSTAIVLRALSERREMEAPHGRFIVGTLIFQDLCVVPMVLIVPLLGAGGGGASIAVDVALALGKAALVMAAVFVSARLVVPHLLRWVDEARSREVFLLAVLSLCIGTAYLTSLAGLSLALGAFLGGMIVAETDYGHRALGDMMPLRDTFVSVFFVSLGMLFDVRVVLEHPLVVALLLAGFLFGKGFLATVAALANRFPARAAWLAGVGLAQFGEFGFVLARLGQKAGIVDAVAMSQLLAAGVMSMFLTPLLVRLAPRIRAGERLIAPVARLLGGHSIDEVDEPGHEKPREHVVIVGYGVAGRLLARSLRSMGVPYVILELNSDTVRSARKEGEPIWYGDATSEEALAHAHVYEARAVAVMISDDAASERTVDLLRRIAPEVRVIVRTQMLHEVDRLHRLGAQEVVAAEVESAVEVLARVLRRLGAARNVVEDHVRRAREVTLQSARGVEVAPSTFGAAVGLEALQIDSVELAPFAHAVGQSLAELDVRAVTGGAIVAIRRDGALWGRVDPHRALCAGDQLWVVGEPHVIGRTIVYLVDGDRPSNVTSAMPAVVPV